MTKAIKKCEKCKGKMYVKYIRINLGNGKRFWKSIGYYCLNCKHEIKNKKIDFKNFIINWNLFCKDFLKSKIRAQKLYNKMIK